MNLKNLSKKIRQFLSRQTGTNWNELERSQMNYEEVICAETLSEISSTNFEASRQRNALYRYNLSEDDFPDEVILHTGRISKLPEKYEPCESVDTEEESESVSITSIISTELECSDADSKGNLEGFVSYSSSDEE